MPGVMEERKNVPFTLVKRKTDESLEKILALRYAYPMEAVASQ